jgi:hypothetical protein
VGIAVRPHRFSGVGRRCGGIACGLGVRSQVEITTMAHRRLQPPAQDEDAAPVTQLLLVRLISEGLDIVVGSLVGEEEVQAQEFAVDAGPEVRRQ